MERSILVCFQYDKVNLKEKMQKTDIVDHWTRERANAKWRLYKFTKVTVFASLLKSVPMDWKDTVLPECHLKSHNVICLNFETKTRQPCNENFCFFQVLALHLYDNVKLEKETSKKFSLFLPNCEEGDCWEVKGVYMNDIPKFEDLLQLTIFLYDIAFVDGKLIGELFRRSIQNFDKNVKLQRQNNHVCYVNNFNASFHFFRCSTWDAFFLKTGDARRFYPYSTCQPMPIGLFKRGDYENVTQRFTSRQNKSSSSENMVLSFFQQLRSDCKKQCYVSTGRQNKIDFFSLDGVWNHCNTVLKLWDGIITLFFVTKHDLLRVMGVKKRKQGEMCRDYIQQKGFQIGDLWECEWWSLYKTDASVRNHLRENFPHKRSLGEE